LPTSQFPLWAGCAVTVASFTVAGIAGKYSEFFRNATFPAPGERFGQLDGLRAYLAFAVFLTHAASSAVWYQTGTWAWPDSTFYVLCGRVSVGLFFMITGFLFSRKLMLEHSINWHRLYLSRLRRLAPLYLFVTAVIFIIVGQTTGWTLRVPPSQLINAVSKWITLGVLGHVNINGVPETWIINPATWTLRYEWAFYLMLPVLALAVTPWRFAVVAGIVLLLVYGFNLLNAVSINFLFGIFGALIVQRRAQIHELKTSVAAVLAMSGLCATALPFARGFGIWQSVLLFPLFVCTLYGNSFFGLLSSRAARVLGLVSYSVYLTHCVLLYVCLRTIDREFPIAGMNDVAYFGVTMGIGLLLIGVSLLTYRFVEHPFISGQWTGRGVLHDLREECDRSADRPGENVSGKTSLGQDSKVVSRVR
jgi:peptidoglycan/LPS O-acetylase OafA/YrhL